jgi:hypothetical protein
MLSESRSIVTEYPYLAPSDIVLHETDLNCRQRVDLTADEPSSAVDHPQHYHAESGVEVIDAIEAWGLSFALGNVVKYVARSSHKGNAREDLQKALWYLTHELAKYDD